MKSLVDQIVSGKVSADKLDELLAAAAKAKKKATKDTKDDHDDRHLNAALDVAKKSLEEDSAAEEQQQDKKKKKKAPELHPEAHSDENTPHGTHEDAHKKSAHKMSYASGPPPSEFWDAGPGHEDTGHTFVAPTDAALDARPLLEFVMIVKNEATAIKETIDSVKPWVDRYTILDTGSTDGTQDIIREAFGDVPGTVHEEGFVDFATSRDRVIELAGTQSVFVFMLSGDETLVDGASFRKFCEQRRHWSSWAESGGEFNTGDQEEAYNVRVHYASDVYDSTRLHRTDARWYYVGVTHEYMTNAKRQVATQRVEVDGSGGTGQRSDGDGIPYIHHDLTGSTFEGKKKRWQLDLKLLLGDWEMNPNRTRTAFYIAQTHECLRLWEGAFKWYQTRFELGGWKEEAYEAKFRMGRVSRHLGVPWIESQQHYLDAHAYLPARAEPLYAVAHYWHSEQKNYPLSYIYALRGSQIKFPAHLRLFVDKTVYDFKIHDLLGIIAYYVNEHAIGKKAVLKALELYPDDKRLIKNLSFYLTDDDIKALEDKRRR
eukprot:g3914.t1